MGGGEGGRRGTSRRVEMTQIGSRKGVQRNEKDQGADVGRGRKG